MLKPLRQLLASLPTVGLQVIIINNMNRFYNFSLMFLLDPKISTSSFEFDEIQSSLKKLLECQSQNSIVVSIHIFNSFWMMQFIINNNNLISVHFNFQTLIGFGKILPSKFTISKSSEYHFENRSCRRRL